MIAASERFGWAAAAGLCFVVAVPVAFVVLQEIFPEIGAGSLAKPFAHVPKLLDDPKLIRLTFNTLALGVGVSALAAAIAVPLAILRALYRVPFAKFWDVAMLVPFMIPPYIATLGWVLTLQPRGYAQQIFGFHLGPFLFSVWGMALVMALPGMVVAKKGNKGLTRFLRADPADPVASAKLAGVLDVLSDGRQTVLPPSAHPATGREYHWLVDCH